MTYPHPADPTPSDNPHPTTSHPQRTGTRFAVVAGPLTATRVAERTAEATRQGVLLLTVCSEAELLHLQLIQKTLPPGATWMDAVAAIRSTGG